LPGVQARAVISPSFSCGIPGCNPVDNIVEASGGHVHADGFAIGGFDGAGSATADVAFGEMHLFGHFINSGNAQGLGQIRDLLTFTAAKRRHRHAHRRDLRRPWSRAASTGSTALRVAGSCRPTSAAASSTSTPRRATTTSAAYQGSPFGLYQATVHLQAGFAAPLDIELAARAVSVSGGEAVADLVDSLYWTGISKRVRRWRRARQFQRDQRVRDRLGELVRARGARRARAGDLGDAADRLRRPGRGGPRGAGGRLRTPEVCWTDAAGRLTAEWIDAVGAGLGAVRRRARALRSRAVRRRLHAPTRRRSSASRSRPAASST